MNEYDSTSTTTCTGVDPQVCVTQYPPFIVTHDSGDVVFMLGCILFIQILQYLPRLFAFFVKSPRRSN